MFPGMQFNMQDILRNAINAAETRDDSINWVVEEVTSIEQLTTLLNEKKAKFAFPFTFQEKTYILYLYVDMKGIMEETHKNMANVTRS